MTSTMDCTTAVECMRAFMEGELPDSDKGSLLAHVKTCAECKSDFAARREVFQALNTAYNDLSISKSFDDSANSKLKNIREVDTASRQAVASAAARVEGEDGEHDDAMLAGAVAEGGMFSAMAGLPWWGVSVVLHVLIIALAGLISMAVTLPQMDDPMITVTELSQRPEIKEDTKKLESENRNVLETKHDTPPTDPMSKELSTVVVPPELLAKAELGDHFETINPDRPDTSSAFGNPEAQMFHSARGSDDAAGGGGNEGVSLDDMIGVGGASSPGTGGGWGGGNGTGTGVGDGSGRGSFGSRNGGGRRLMVQRHGGSKATEGAVDKALEWLARHQEPDGRWDCQKYEGKAGDNRCMGVNGDAAVTGFAVLAFLGAGHTTKVGKYKDNVQRGVYWLMQKLDEGEKAGFGPGRWCAAHGSNYTQGVAALALAEACGMSPRDGELKKSAQRAIDGVVHGQITTGGSEYQAWDYDPKKNVNDTSVTGWNIMALKAGKIAGLKIDHFSFEGAMAWINAGQDLTNAPMAGDAEYWEGGKMAYNGTLAAPNKGAGGEAMFSAAALTRLMVGGERPDSPGVAGPCNLMKKPEHLPNKWPGNLYYWYYGTLTMFQKGGDHWKAWNEPMKKILPEKQRKDGDFDGSWDVFYDYDGGHIYGGRVMSTSLGALCLQVYYRYQKLNN